MSECIETNLATSRGGYGRKRIHGRETSHHRWVYAQHHDLDVFGDEMRGLDVDHLCRNKRCVNVDHLELVSHSVNLQRGSGTKMSEFSVGWVRSFYSWSGFSQSELAQMFGVGKTAIRGIISYDKWPVRGVPNVTPRTLDSPLVEG